MGRISAVASTSLESCHKQSKWPNSKLEQNIDMNTFLRRLKYFKGITYQYFFGSEKAIQLLKRV